MDERFRINIEQLRDGQERELNERFAPDFLDVHEESLSFPAEVQLSGLVTVADKELVFKWDIETEAAISCSICNEPVLVPLSIQGCYHSIPLEEIKTGVYDYKELLRETILLETPAFAECEGSCPKRKEIKKFLKKSDVQEPEGYHPFADLSWEEDHRVS